MKVGFYCQSEGPHWDIGVSAVKSVQRFMPGVEVYHLTNEECPVLPGAKAYRTPKDCPMGIHRIKQYCELEGDWIFCDSDVIFLRDVRPVFQDSFDIALATRKGSFLEGSQYESVFPYNFGVVYSRSQEFWREVLKKMEALPEKKQEWEGEQFVTGRLAKSGRYAFKELPREFNYTPESINEDLSHVSVLHLKWKRKAWLPHFGLDL